MINFFSEYLKELIITIISSIIISGAGIVYIEMTRPKIVNLTDETKHPLSHLSLDEKIQVMRVQMAILNVNYIIKPWNMYYEINGKYPDSYSDLYNNFDREKAKNLCKYEPEHVHDGKILIESTHILPKGILYAKLTDEFGEPNSRLVLIPQRTDIGVQRFDCIVNFQHKYKNTANGHTCKIDAVRISELEETYF